MNSFSLLGSSDFGQSRHACGSIQRVVCTFWRVSSSLVNCDVVVHLGNVKEMVNCLTTVEAVDRGNTLRLVFFLGAM